MLSKPRTSSPLAVATAALAAALVLAACGSSGGTPTQTSSGTSTAPSSNPAPSSSTGAPRTTASGPAPVEHNPPGDIPDNQAFVPYRGTGFTVTTPEGWARSASGSSVVFSDKYNSITITPASAPKAPTVASARTNDIPAIKARSQGFVAGPVSTAQRTAGTAVLITYHAYSPVNPVTGKVANEAVEHYTFWRAGRSVTLTLAAPVGSDNVDPWRKVTDSFTWTK
ncbi:MAG: hypothetical protein ACRDVG_01205 [Jatrophihabitantaceae bacterium]